MHTPSSHTTQSLTVINTQLRYWSRTWFKIGSVPSSEWEITLGKGAGTGGDKFGYELDVCSKRSRSVQSTCTSSPTISLIINAAVGLVPRPSTACSLGTRLTFVAYVYSYNYSYRGDSLERHPPPNRMGCVASETKQGSDVYFKAVGKSSCVHAGIIIMNERTHKITNRWYAYALIIF